MATIEAARPVDGDKLMEFVFRAVDEVGATLNAALVVMGDKLGLYRALAGAGGRSPRPSSRERTGHRRALRARVAQRPGGRRLRRLRPRQRPLHAAARAGGRAHRRGQPGLPARVLPDRARLGASTRRGSPRRRAAATGVGWHEHVPRRARGLRAVLPARLQREPRRRTGCRRSTASSRSSSAGATVADVGCGHGASTILMAQAFPSSTLRRLRLPRRLDRDRARARGRGGRRRTACASTRLAAAAYTGDGLRPRDDVRLPARHGRPGRRRAPRPRDAHARTARG